MSEFRLAPPQELSLSQESTKDVSFWGSSEEKVFYELSQRHNLKLSRGVIRDLARCIEADNSRVGSMSSENMSTELGRLPTCLPRTTTTLASLGRHCAHHNSTASVDVCGAGHKHSRLRCWWRRNRRRIGWISVLAVICLALFLDRAWYFLNSPAFDVLGWTLPLSRGSAEALKFLFAAILLPVSRLLLWFTWQSPLSHFVKFRSSIDAHRGLGIAIALFTFLHVSGHMFNAYHILRPHEVERYKEVFSNGGPTGNFPFGEAPPSFVELLLTIPLISGLMLTLLWILGVVWSFSGVRRRIHGLLPFLKDSYSTFLNVHNLQLLMFPLLIVHGSQGWLAKMTIHWWMVGPCILYLIDWTLTRFLHGGQKLVVSDASLYCEIANIVLEKPDDWNRRFVGARQKACMYVRVKFPGVNREWHPFTLTSTAQDDFMRIHVQRIGNWTNEVFNKFSRAIKTGSRWPTIHVQGPYGAPCSDYHEFDMVVAFGAGVGITPFVAMLRDMAQCKQHRHHGKTSFPQCVYVCFSTRVADTIPWLQHMVSDVLTPLQELDVEIQPYLTAVDPKSSCGEILQNALTSHYETFGYDALFGADVAAVQGDTDPLRLTKATRIGRCDLNQMLARMRAKKHKLFGRDATTNIGVLTCGPAALQKQLRRVCAKASDSKTKFRFVCEKF